MSAFLKVDAFTIDMYGVDTNYCRTFTKTVNVIESNDFQSCLVLYFKTNKVVLPNRIKMYNNHFCLYVSDTSILVVLCEAKLSSSLKFFSITPTECYRWSNEQWDVSFDDVEFSSKPPRSFSDYILHSHGEWWYYDNGYILNGKRFSLNTRPHQVFIYIELHRKVQLTVGKQTSSQQVIQSSNTTTPDIRTQPSAEQETNIPTETNEILFNREQIKTHATTNATVATAPNLSSEILDLLFYNIIGASNSNDRNISVVGRDSGSNHVAYLKRGDIAFSTLDANPALAQINNCTNLKLRNIAPQMDWFIDRTDDLLACNISEFVPIEIRSNAICSPNKRKNGYDYI